MSSLNEMNQALRRETSHSRWLLELTMPSVALGRGLPRNEPTAEPRAAAELRAANANRPGDGLVASLVRAAVRAVRRRHTASLLRQLDARLLDDIGITHGDIDAIATKAAAEATGRKGTIAMPRFAFLTALRRAWQRQAAIAALQRLSDHTLADIGLERRRIAESVDVMMAGDKAVAAPARTVFAVQPAQPAPAVEAPTARKATAPARKAA